MPSRGFWRGLIEERLLLAAILLVVLCLWAMWKAPVVTGASAGPVSG